jgi:hypothetical protein
VLKVPRWNRIPQAVGLALSILCIAGVGCDVGKDPYHLPAARVEGDQAVALFVTGSWSHSFKTYANVQLPAAVQWLGLVSATDR